MSTTLSAPRKHVHPAGPKALFDFVKAQVDAKAAAHLCETGQRMTSQERADAKADVLWHETDWPLAVTVAWGTHVQVLSSDGVTRYDVSRPSALEPWRCSCKASGPCWHRRYALHSMYFADMVCEHLPIDAVMREPIDLSLVPDGLVRTPAGKSRLFHDEVA